MSRQFSIATVYRMVTNDLLAQFFTQLKNPCYSMDWNRRPRRHVVSMECLMKWFDPQQREAAELILRNVFDLACRTGIEAIRNAGRALHQSQRLRELPDGNLYCQALWTWLHAPEVFEHALLFHEVDQLSWWSQRDELPQVEARTDDEALHWLAGDVARLLTEHQGRGRRCTIEHVRRDDGIDYFFCFPDDHLQTVLVHDQADELVTKTLRQTFEMVFAWSRAAGTLELSARLGKRLKEQLEESFAWMILEEQIGPREPRQVYDLNRLKERGFVLDTDPADQVRARVRTLCLDLPDHRRRIILTSKNGPGDDMQQMVDQCLNREHVSLRDVQITEAQFQLQFARTTRSERGTMTFAVAQPDRCNLRRHRPDRVAVAQRHLKLWRIAQ